MTTPHDIDAIRPMETLPADEVRRLRMDSAAYHELISRLSDPATVEAVAKKLRFSHWMATGDAESVAQAALQAIREMV